MRFSVARGYARPALKREDDPKWWDEFHARVEARTAAREADEPEQWPQSRQVALLLIERSASALDCIAHLVGSAHPQRQEDFVYLRKEGYAVRPLGERYHRLTPFGQRAAKALSIVIGKRLGLHHVAYHFDSFHEHKASCCCGFVTYKSRRGGYPKPALQAAIAKHLADPLEWQRSHERTQAVINGVFATGGGDGG